MGSQIPKSRLAALALTALTVLFTTLYSLAQPACGTGIDTDWAADPFKDLAVLAGTAAVLAGVVLLFMRHWVIALVSFAVNLSMVGLMISTTCPFS